MFAIRFGAGQRDHNSPLLKLGREESKEQDLPPGVPKTRHILSI